MIRTVGFKSIFARAARAAAAPTWINLGGPVTTAGATLTVADTNGPGNQAQRFYRLLVSP